MTPVSSHPQSLEHRMMQIRNAHLKNARPHPYGLKRATRESNMK